MKVLHLAFHFAEYAVNLSRALASQHEVVLFLSRSNARAELMGPVGEPGNHGLCSRLLPDYQLRNPLFLANALDIVRTANRFRPDVIHCQDAQRDYLALAVKFLRKTPLVVTIHDHKPHSGHDSNTRPRMERYRRWLHRRADALIVHGDRIRAEAEVLFPAHRGRVFSVPHGILGQGSADTRFALDPAEPVRLLFFGRIETYKGLGHLLDAIAIVRARHHRVTLTIAGTGHDLARHRQRIASDPGCTLIERFIPADQIAPLFAATQIVVMPYEDATQSGVAALAARFGRPVVATDVGSVGELVRNGENGLLVPPRDPAAFATAIERLIVEPGLAAACAAHARHRAATDLSWPAIASQTARVYEAAIRRSRQHAAGANT